MHTAEAVPAWASGPTETHSQEVTENPGTPECHRAAVPKANCPGLECSRSAVPLAGTNLLQANG